MTNIERFQHYLACYEQKDIESIDAMFAADIHLRDWKISVFGKETAMSETRKNFAAAASVRIEVLGCFENHNTVAGELRIVVDENEVLYVADVITFDESGLITSIHAYLGRED